MKLLDIGKSVRGKPMVMAVISTPANLKEMDRFKAISRRLRDDRDLDEKEARKLVADGKTIVLITCSLHATEIGASQMSMELAWRLATGHTPFNAREILDKVILLLVPTINPDGVQMVVEWYKRNRNTPYEGGRMPWLYHDYAGHDNNRDWFMGNLPETRAVMRVLYHDWIPQIHIDEHQMGSTGARLFVPPFMDPPTEPVHPLVWRGVALCGSHMAYRMQEKNLPGVVHGRSFTGWWIGACDDTSWLHNAVGILSEMASVRIATPVFVDPGEISDDYSTRSMQFPQPWKGGWWRLRDIVDYELSLSMGLVEAAAMYRDSFLYNFYRMCRDEVKGREKGLPQAFLIPDPQHDAPTARRMLRILRMGGVEVHKTLEESRNGDRVVPGGTWVVRMDQPYRPYAQALLEKQNYPDMRQYPGGPPIPPYDNAGWTLPLQMGVKCIAVTKPLTATTKPVVRISDPEIEIPLKGKIAVLNGAENASHMAAYKLVEKGLPVWKFMSGNGDFLVDISGEGGAFLQTLQRDLGFSCNFPETIPQAEKVELRYPRIGIYRSWNSCMDEGWTRYMLNDAGIQFKTLRNKDFTSGKKLHREFNVIVFASEDRHLIVTGEPAPDSPWKRYYSPLPPKYRGGIGKSGVKALKEFVSLGGHLVCLNRSTDLVFNEFSPPARNVLQGVKRKSFFCPRSILAVDVDNTHPIGLGMPARASVVFADSPAFSTWIPRGEWERRVVARYPRKDILESGWLLGQSHLSRRAALVDLEYGQGSIVLVGFRAQSRAQSHGTYKFLFNAFLRSAWIHGE